MNIFSVKDEAAPPAASSPNFFEVARGAASSRLAFADGLRGLAALWVVLFHLSEGRHIDHLRAVLPDWLNLALFDTGHLGVAVFFPLSGFVMALTLPSGISRLEFLRFMVRRLARLTPPYYFAIAFSLLMIWVKIKMTGVDAPWLDGSTVFFNMVYLQNFFSVRNINEVFWTLCIEMQFYLAYGLLLWGIGWFTRRNPSSLWGQVILHISAWGSLGGAATFSVFPGIQGLFLPFWYSFMAGLLACHGWQQSGWVRVSSIVFILSLLVIGLTRHSAFMAAVAITAGALMAVGVLGAMSKCLNWGPLQSLALFSYSLYLLHNPLTGAVSNLVRRLMPSGAWTDLLVAILSIAICLVAARLAYLWIELPSMTWSKRWSSKASHVLR